MSQIMIIARMQPEDNPAVADIFSRFDATSMPHEIGVESRSLYAFRGLYVHLVDFGRDQAQSMVTAQKLPAFRTMSDELSHHISPYDPSWRSPRDAMAGRFYHWTPSGGAVVGDAAR